MLNKRSEALLLLLSVGENKPLDPVRIMKSMFVFTMEAKDEWIPKQDRYDFVPYNYGPCSFELYDDLDELVSKGFIKTEQLPDRSWKYFALTAKGVEVAKSIASKSNAAEVKYLTRIREYVDGCSFNQLLTGIYKAYPQYAVNSVFKR